MPPTGRLGVQCPRLGKPAHRHSGESYYGHTVDGQYMTEAEAIQAGS